MSELSIAEVFAKLRYGADSDWSTSFRPAECALVLAALDDEFLSEIERQRDQAMDQTDRAVEAGQTALVGWTAERDAALSFRYEVELCLDVYEANATLAAATGESQTKVMALIVDIRKLIREKLSA